MTEGARRWDPWAIPTLFLWILFFAIGLDTQSVFHFLREISFVVTQNAFINSPDVLTMGLALYFAIFTYQRCSEAELPNAEAHGKAVQTGIVAMVAFLWHPLNLLLHVNEIDTGSITWTLYLRGTVYFMALMKLLCWLYLLSLVIRFYGLGNRRVFVDMYCIFPSAHHEESPPENVLEGSGTEWTEGGASPSKESSD